MARQNRPGGHGPRGAEGKRRRRAGYQPVAVVQMPQRIGVQRVSVGNGGQLLRLGHGVVGLLRTQRRLFRPKRPLVGLGGILASDNCGLHDGPVQPC